MSFKGKRVLALESRRATETAELIRRNGGVPTVAPSMQEVPLGANAEAFAFAEDLLAGKFDLVIFLTGVGTRFLAKVIATRYPPERFTEALQKVIVAARGPKPAAALRELNVPVQVIAPEPNTWRELLALLRNRPEKRIALQEYGRPSTELVQALEAGCATVRPVPVYQWALPDDTGPLLEAAKRLAREEFDVVLFTTSQQLVHLLEIAREEGLEEQVLRALRRTFLASIGPTTTEMLSEYGLTPSMEPSHPKLGIFVKEAADLSSALESHASLQTS